MNTDQALAVSEQFFSKENQKGSDFILRSSDGTDFYVHKKNLDFCSTTFTEMFTACTSGGGNDDPVLQLVETSETLHNMVPYFYLDYDDDAYLHKRTDATIPQYKDALIFADKYAMYQKVMKRLLEGLT